MVDTRYLAHMLVAALLSLVVTALFYLNGRPGGYAPIVAAYAFAVAFVSLVVIRLPVFREYYNRDRWRLAVRRRSMAERRAAPVMSSLVTVVVFGVLAYVAGVPEPGVAIMCSWVSAGVMSLYHEGRR